jgi:TetR/AcrR family transcriptional regulator, transcriptional repressor for nem operon
VARSGRETKAAATEVLEKLLVTLADSQSGPEARGDAIVALATMIGAMTMARIVSDTVLSNEILNRAKDHLHRGPSGDQLSVD